MAEVLAAERAHGVERESELRRVKQREYAEQQLRVEAEDQLVGVEREGREEARRLAQRLGAGERETGELSRRIESLQRQLSEAEQTAVAERAALKRAEQELQGRVAELERRAAEIQDGLLAERSARERSERELASIREGHRRMEGLLGEVRAVVGRLGTVLASARRAPRPPAAPPPPPPVSPAARLAGEQRGAEMADALAAAVERLRERALSAPPLPEDPEEPGGPAGEQRPALPGRAPDARAPTPPPLVAAERPAEPAPAAQAPRDTAAGTPRGKTHKHSESLIRRLRNRRKQRRSG